MIPGDSPSEDRNDELSVIAHRGFKGVYPENTVSAVREASKVDVEMVEVDAMPTKDGRVVAFHDDRLSGREGIERGPTDREGIVWETPWHDLQNAELLDSGEPIPLLRDIFDAVPPEISVNAELKNPGTENVRRGAKFTADELATRTEVWRPFVEDVLAVARDYENDLLVSSLYEAALAAVREVDSDVPVAFMLWDSLETGLDIARRHDCEAIYPPWNMVPGTPFFGMEYYTSGPFADVDLVGIAHDEGRVVRTWAVDNWYQAARLAEAGVDGILANYPGLLRKG